MPWHLSRSDTRKVYDQTHAAVCVCQTAEQAALIVEAVNKLGPERYRGKESGDTTSTGAPNSEHGAPVSITQTYQEEECCGKHLAKAIRTGSILNVWNCPKCGCDWTGEQVGTVRNWKPIPLMEVI